jgi:hypothetical protein
LLSPYVGRQNIIKENQKSQLNEKRAKMKLEIIKQHSRESI